MIECYWSFSYLVIPRILHRKKDLDDLVHNMRSVFIVLGGVFSQVEVACLQE